MLQNPRPGSDHIQMFCPALRQHTCPIASMMTKEADSDRIRELCSQIAVEKDRHKLLQLIDELSRLLGAKDQSIKDKQIGS